MIPNEGDVLASVIELDLSHNAIISIDNIEQFRNVEFVNLSHNRVIDPLEILKLQKLEKLHTLYLKGNPFLRSKIGLKSLSFLLSLSTDVELVSP
jgi:Leucine-rich repeat (LRR) protein